MSKSQAEWVDAAGRATWPTRLNLAEYFVDEPAASYGADRTALLTRDAQRTYAELEARSRRVASGLRELGVRPEERVVIALPDGFEFAEAFFGTLRMGAVFAMLNPLLGAEAYAGYLRYTKARVAFVPASLLAEFTAAFEQVAGCLELVVVGGDAGPFLDFESWLAGQDPSSVRAETEPTGPDDLAGWLFTSGSTGTPKACVHTHSDVVFSTETYARRIARYGPDEDTLGVPKLFFGYATGTNLMFPLRFGGRAVLFPERSTPDALFDLAERFQPTLLTSVPTMIGQMLQSERLSASGLASLRVVLSAGEALPAPLYSAWKERTGVEILDGIGSAEMFHIYISNRFDDVKLGSLGKLVPGYEAQIIDPDGLELPNGQPGRLRIGGESTALCYWANRAASRETFAGRWCTSADVFVRDGDGYFSYQGRSDDLMKVSGIWVSPLEIEGALLGHEAVAEVCVVPREDESGLVKPLALVVPASGHVGDDALGDTLKAHAKSKLAPHKYPRWFEWRSELPKNDRGKVARRKLVEEQIK